MGKEFMKRKKNFLLTLKYKSTLRLFFLRSHTDCVHASFIFFQPLEWNILHDYADHQCVMLEEFLRDK